MFATCAAVVVCGLIRVDNRALFCMLEPTLLQLQRVSAAVVLRLIERANFAVDFYYRTTTEKKAGCCCACLPARILDEEIKCVEIKIDLT